VRWRVPGASRPVRIRPRLRSRLADRPGLPLCTLPSGYANPFPPDNPTADYADGETAADHAKAAAVGLGFSNSVIYFDLEGWGGTGGDCLTSAENFIEGWEHELNALGWTGGLYGSAASSRMDSIYTDTNPRPTEAWVADYVAPGDESWMNPWDLTNSNPGVPDGDWVDDHRFHQYFRDSSTSQDCHGGLCMKVDRNCSIGVVAMANLTFTENSEPSGTVENDGETEDVPPCS